MDRLFTGAGWLDFPSIRRGSLDYPFTFIWGARQIGKTYGALQDVRVDDPVPFILLRRTQTMVDILAAPGMSPFQKIDDARGVCTVIEPIPGVKYVHGIYDAKPNDNGVPKASGSPIGMLMALTTLHNIRGFSSNADIIILDEFIPQRNERTIKGEFDAFLNAYETINSNRELFGRPPVHVFALANANNINNPYFAGFGLLRVAEKMQREGKIEWADRDRGIRLINVEGSPISGKKSKTALYKAAKNTTFSQMALSNDFAYDVPSRIQRLPLPECKPVVFCGALAIYKHKSQPLFYVCEKRSGTAPIYGDDDTSLKRFYARYVYLWDAYISNNVLFDDYTCEIKFRSIFGQK